MVTVSDQQRRSILGRIISSLCTKDRPLTASEKVTIDAAARELQHIAGVSESAMSESQRKHEGAFLSYLRHGLSREAQPIISRTGETYFQRGITQEEMDILAGENRSMGTAGQAAYPGATTAFFAPMGFRDQVESALKYYGPMLDVSTVYDTASGGAPMAYSSDNDATISGEMLQENDQVTEQDIPIGQVILRSYRFTSRMVKLSIELVQDISFPLDLYLAERFGIRIARAANPMFTIGTGIAQPTGIITAAAAAGPAVASVGSSANTGGSDPAGSTIGSDDLVNLEQVCDPAYRIGGAYMLHSDTLAMLKRLKDKNGRPVYLFDDPDEIVVNGYPVVLNNAMDKIPSVATSPATVYRTVAFGNFAKYTIRHAPLLVQRLPQRFADYGTIGYLATSRMDGALVDGGGQSVKLLTHTF